MTADPCDPIEDYLDELLLRLHLPPRDTRRLLAEIEDHLAESAACLEDLGRSPSEAAREAVRRLGSPADVAAAAGSARHIPAVAVIGLVAQGALALLAAGLIAIGASGALAALTNALAGHRLVGALPTTYPAATCSYYLAAHPGASTCAQAAMLETSQDAVVLRLLAGVAGLAVLAAVWMWRRRWRGDGGADALAIGATAAAATGCFAAAAAVLAGIAVDLGVQHGSGGTGFYLTGAAAAAVGAALSGRSAYRRLSRQRPWRPAYLPATG